MSSDCIRLVVVAVTLLLSDVTCQTVHNISISNDVHSGRQRRQAYQLTEDDISAAVDRHNALRALEGAANMELMKWNSSLARAAADWAAKCKSGHSETGAGQNKLTGPITMSKDLAAVTNSWYIEKEEYDFDTITCRKEPCGHYTQVVWANSRSVGCAVHRCGKVGSAVCDYWPAGNYGGERPYKKGPACSKCPNGAGWCKNKLCNWQCTRAGENCLCAAICYNCAKLDLETCRCKCAKGWHGVDCSERCKNIDPLCGHNPGWYSKKFCVKDDVKILCAAWCGVCKADPNAEEGLCPPVRGPFADSAQTMFIKSDKSTMIFVIMVIIAFTIISYDAL